MKTLIAVCLFTLSFSETKALNQPQQLFVYNIGFNAITGGIGAIINKKSREKVGKTFLNGLIKGSAGGLLIYSAKKMETLVYNKNNTWYGLPANLIHSAGTSIVENAALNRPANFRYNFTFGPLRLQLFLRDSIRLNARIMPYSTFAVIQGIHYGRSLDLKRTLSTGEIVFSHPTKTVFTEDGQYYNGYSLGGSVVLSKDVFKINNGVMAHEQIHQFQYREYMNLNTWLNPMYQEIKGRKLPKFLSKYIYADIPWFNLFYVSEGYHSYDSYYKNFYEFEAQRLSVNMDLQR